MAEQIIDIRERIEKMRIKFDDDHKSDNSNIPNKEAYEENREFNNFITIRAEFSVPAGCRV